MAQLQVDTFLNVVSRKEELLYLPAVPPSAANIAFVSTPPLSSGANVVILDRSMGLPGNYDSVSDVQFFPGKNRITTNSTNFLVTDEYADGTGGSHIPLFWMHKFNPTRVRRTGTSDELASGVRINAIKLFDSNKDEIDTPLFTVDYSRGYVFSNYLSDFTNALDHSEYYIQYTVIDGTDVTTYTDLLSQEKIFREATVGDLTPTLSLINDGRKVYLIDETSAGVTLTFPKTADYALVTEFDARLQLVKPVEKGRNDSWFMRVTNGQFFHSVLGQSLKYSVPEFISQNWNPGFPIKRVTDEESEILSPSLIKLDQLNIVNTSEPLFFLNIQINDKEDNGILAFTSDPRPSSDPEATVGTIAPNGKEYLYWSTALPVGIRSVDIHTGLVDVQGIQLDSSQHKVISSYNYTETFYEYTALDLNPIHNPKLLDKKIVFFAVPSEPSSPRLDSVYYLIVNETNLIIDSNWPDTITRYPNYTFFPEGVSEYVPNHTCLKYEKEPPGMLGCDNFKRRFDVNGSILGPDNRMFIIGEVSIDNVLTPSDVPFLDTRVEGGGIREDRIDEAKQIEPEVVWYLDEGYWDGSPYPGTASYLVEIPADITIEAGGSISQEQIRDSITKHSAAGVYPVIRYYGHEITMTNVSVTNTSITLEW